jgi:hypothetical protein
MVIAIHGASRVGDVLARQGLGEFDGCNIIRSLVVAGFARIEVPAEAPVAVVTVPVSDVPLLVAGSSLTSLGPPDTLGRADPPSSSLWPSVALLSESTLPVELEVEPRPGQDNGVSHDPAMSGDGDAAGPMNRGLLLKFLSSVRS